MEQNQAKQNNHFFWIVCFVTVVGAIFWSLTSLLQTPSPLYIAFSVINGVALATNLVCFILDRKNRKNET